MEAVAEGLVAELLLEGPEVAQGEGGPSTV